MLNLGDVLQQLQVGQRQVGVPEAAVRKQIFDAFFGLARIDAVADGLRCGGRLPLETVDHGLHRRGLVCLRFEFEFHGVMTCCLCLWSAKPISGSTNSMLSFCIVSAILHFCELAERYKLLIFIGKTGFSFCKSPRRVPTRTGIADTPLASELGQQVPDLVVFLLR
jgi:hypothetical protein